MLNIASVMTQVVGMVGRVHTASSVPYSVRGMDNYLCIVHVVPLSFSQDPSYLFTLMRMTCLRELHFSVCPFLSHLQVQDFNCCLTP